MGSKVICLPCCLIVLVTLIDPGDGQWKKLRLDELKHDVITLEKLAENLDHEIETFYVENGINDQTNQHGSHHHHSKRKHKNKRKPKISTIPPSANTTENINHNDITNAHAMKNISKEPNAPDKEETKINKSSMYWPKFEEILSMNHRKYDWKNDRWIKLRKNVKPIKEYHESNVHKTKHRFNYRRVRLNSGKAKGNVVIAVSAVR